MRNQAYIIEGKINATEGLVQPLINSGLNLLTNLSYCGSFGDFYGDAKADFCNGVVPAMSYIALTSLVIALFACPSAILTIILGKRMPNPHIKNHDDNQEIIDQIDPIDPNIQNNNTVGMAVSSDQAAMAVVVTNEGGVNQEGIEMESNVVVAQQVV